MNMIFANGYFPTPALISAKWNKVKALLSSCGERLSLLAHAVRANVLHVQEVSAQNELKGGSVDHC